MKKKNNMVYFTGDEHYGHRNVIKYCNRPFQDVEEMDREIIKRHNEVVSDNDIVYHLGDFSLKKNRSKYLEQLKGKHIFIKGNHDKEGYDILEIKIDGQSIVLCHYAMRVWNKSHYGSWELFGHSHNTLEPIGKQMDVGVDTNNFYPYSFEDVKRKIEGT